MYMYVHVCNDVLQLSTMYMYRLGYCSVHIWKQICKGVGANAPSPPWNSRAGLFAAGFIAIVPGECVWYHVSCIYMYIVHVHVFSIHTFTVYMFISCTCTCISQFIHVHLHLYMSVLKIVF